jgi:hypothetical protein
MIMAVAANAAASLFCLSSDEFLNAFLDEFFDSPLLVLIYFFRRKPTFFVSFLLLKLGVCKA